MQKVLVTGCNGFIGRYICAELKAKKYYVIGLSREQNALAKVDKYVQADVSAVDFGQYVLAKINECDVIVHTAAKISNDDFDTELISVNCLGANNIVKLAKKMQCRKIVNTSSAPIIGRPILHPITEEHLVSPLSLYHVTKLAQEHICNLASKYGIAVINARISSPIGVGMNSHTILPVFLRQCLQNQPITIIGRGSRQQNYIDVRDVAAGIEKCISVENALGCYNLTSDKTISNFDLAKSCITWTNSQSKIIYDNAIDLDEGLVWDFSIEKAQRELGFNLHYSLHDTVSEMLKVWEQLN